MFMYAIAHGGCMNTVLQPALKVDWGGEGGDSLPHLASPRQQRAEPDVQPTGLHPPPLFPVHSATLFPQTAGDMLK